MELKHTPGPWVITPVKLKPESKSYPCIIEAPGYCDIYKGGTSFWALGGRSIEESEANAKLIAAAPELLDVLTQLTEPFSTLISVPAGAKFTVTYDAELAYKALNLIIKATK